MLRRNCCAVAAACPPAGRAKIAKAFVHHQHGIARLFMVESAISSLPILSAQASNQRFFNLGNVLQREHTGQR